MTDLAASLASLSPEKRALLQQMLARKGMASAGGIPPHGDGPAPLTLSQERLWFLHRLDPGGAGYAIPAAQHLHGPVDLPALERALNEIVARHEPLRTAIRSREGIPEQHVLAPVPIRLVPHDLSALAEPGRGDEVRRRVREEAARPWDLENGPLFRAGLLRLAPDEHVLLLTLHHVIADGWSLGILFRELGALYGAFSRGEASPLPPLPLRYADFAAWQRAGAGQARLDAQLAWWTERLAGAPTVLELPTDHPRPAAPAGHGARERLVLPPELLARLHALARERGASLYMVLLAGFGVVLARWSGQDDLLVGTPVAGRTRREVEGLIGLFVNTLALRVELSGDPSFEVLVGRVREMMLDAQSRAEVPLERLVEALRPERAAGRAPLFQVMLTLQNAVGRGPELPGLRARPLDAGTAGAKFDLSLTAAETRDGLTATLDYAAELFDGATAARLLRHLRTLLAAAVDAPERSVRALPLMDGEERAALAAWSGTRAEYPSAAVRIHHHVAAQAARTPHAVAVVHEEVRLTYVQVNAAANRAAAALSAEGTGPGHWVPILMERGPGVPVAMLAVMKTGAAFVPLDPQWPDERLRGVLDELGGAPLLADPGSAGRARALGAACIVVDAAAAAGAADPGDPAGEPGADDPVYVIYTSGSTGRPKGAAVPHRGIDNRFAWMTATFGVEAAASVLQTTRHVYDSAVWQLLWPLTVGGRTVVPPAGAEADAARLSALIRNQKVTMTDFVPSVFNVLVPRLVQDGGARERLASLHTVVVGGEAITAETTYAFMECFPAVRVVNLYGPTEASIGCICHQVTGREGGRIPIGRPIANTHALILDAAGGLAPPGVPGEIHLGGVCVGLGYLGDGGRTARAFVPNPFPHVAGRTLYRTGDRARWLADGSIEFLGRVDDQVKIRGFRIEPGEVEAALQRHPAVADAVVVARGHDGEKRLAAYVVPAVPGALDVAALRAALRETLPPYMVPAVFVPMAALPLTANGKADRKALPEPSWERGEEGYAPPRDGLEVELAALWEECLRTRPIGIHDPFFDVGGSSLLAVRLVEQAERRFGCRVPLATLVAGGTVAAMAQGIRAERAAGGREPSPRVALRAAGGAPPLFCVHPAEGGVAAYVNLARHLAPGRPVYGLEDPGLLAEGATFYSVPELAGRYVRAILAGHPEGPYHLLGWSFGGCVAFEMACQLREAGARVGVTAVLDAYCPLVQDHEGGEDTVERLASILRNVGAFHQREIPVDLDELRALSDDERYARAAALLREARIDTRGEPWLRRVVAVAVGRRRTLRGYVPRPYAGRVTLLRAAEVDDAVTRPGHPLHDGWRDPALGWGRVTPHPVEVHTVPGTHTTLVAEPHVVRLAATLDACLAAAEAPDPA